MEAWGKLREESLINVVIGQRKYADKNKNEDKLSLNAHGLLLLSASIWMNQILTTRNRK